MGSPGVSHNPFFCRERQVWLLRGRRAGVGWKGWPWGKGRRARGWGLTLTCKVQLPHKLGCFLKSDIRINTQTQLHAHMRRRLCIPEGGDLDLPAPRSSKAGASSLHGPLGWSESSGEDCLVSEVPSTSTQMTLNQIHAKLGAACLCFCVRTGSLCAGTGVPSLPSRAPGNGGADRGG